MEIGSSSAGTKDSLLLDHSRWNLGHPLISGLALIEVQRHHGQHQKDRPAGTDIAPGEVVHCGNSLPDCSATM
jgi:hypothetical protein